MRAMLLRAYGGPDVFELGEVPTPAPAAGEILVRVRGSSVNPVDAFTRSGGLRRFVPLKLPVVLGVDVAGEVVAVGEGARRFRIGDRVYAFLGVDRPGGYGEFVAASESYFARAPANMDLAEAGTVPGVGATAWEAFTYRVPVKPGMRVLIHGASGGVGSFAVQIAKTLGANVTGVCSTKNTDLVAKLGADHVVDHTRTNVRDLTGRFDAILDVVRGSSPSQLRGLLAPGGTLLPIAASPPAALLARAGSAFSSRKVRPFSVERDGLRLEGLTALIEKGSVRPVIHATYDWKDLAEAHRRVEAGGVAGKIAVRSPALT